MDARFDIKLIMEQNHVSYQMLANALGKSKESVYYALNFSNADLGMEFYTKTMTWFEKRGYSSQKKSGNPIGMCLRLNEIMNEELAHFNKSFGSALDDGKLDQKERMQLKSQLVEMRRSFIATIDEIQEKL
jgi:hypothetical protein